MLLFCQKLCCTEMSVDGVFTSTTRILMLEAGQTGFGFVRQTKVQLRIISLINNRLPFLDLMKVDRIDILILNIMNVIFW